VLAEKAQAARRADALQHGGDRVRFDRVRVLALEAEQNRLVGAMADAGERERAEQLAAHARDLRQHAFLLQPALGEARRGAHRAHRVRGGGTDADLEQVEQADSHGCARR